MVADCPIMSTSIRKVAFQSRYIEDMVPVIKSELMSKDGTTLSELFFYMESEKASERTTVTH